MPWFDELVRGLTEGASGVTAREKYGPDWREQLAERQAGRERAAAGEERASASEQIRLADELAKAVSETMAAGEEGGPEQDYSAAIPADLLGRAGVSAEDVLGRARGKTALNKRQLEILRGAQRMEQERARQTGAGERQRAGAEAARERQEAWLRGAMERTLQIISGASARAGQTQEAATKRDEEERRIARLDREQAAIEREESDAEADFNEQRTTQDQYNRRMAKTAMRRQRLSVEQETPESANGDVISGGPAPRPGQHQMPDGSVMPDAEMEGAPAAPSGKDPNRPVKFRGQMVPFSSLPPELQKKIEANGG